MPLSRLSLLSILCLLSSILSSRATATDKYWVGPNNGLWSDPNNWSLTPAGPGGAGPPSNGTDNAFLSSSTTVTAVYDSNYTSAPGLNSLSINAPSGALMTLSQSAGNLTPYAESVGINGVHIQNGGDNLLNSLGVGGSYFLSGSGTISTRFGTSIGGAMVQSGGTNGSSNGIGVTGTYTLSGGSVGADYLELDSGNFNQSGGSVGSDIALFMSRSANNNSTYTLSAGSLNMPTELIGETGSATFNQSGGSNTVTSQGISGSQKLEIGSTSTGIGTYNLSGGSVTANYLLVGSAGIGHLNVSGGGVDVNLSLSVNASSTVSMTAGGIEPFSASVSGSVAQSGGTLFVHFGGLTVNPGGVYDLSGSGVISDYHQTIAGSLRQTGGTNAINPSGGTGTLTIAKTGVYSLSSGSLAVPTATNDGEFAIKPAASTTLAAYTQSLTGNLDLELDGTSPSQYASLDPTTSASLAGLLTIDLPNSFSPQLGDTFLLINSPTLTGTFSSYDLPPLNNGLQWQPTYTPTSFSLTVVIPEPALLLPLVLPAMLLLRHRRPNDLMHRHAHGRAIPPCQSPAK